MSARCSEVLSPDPNAPEVRRLRIVERVEGFVLERFDARGGSVGDELFETLDEAMHYVYSAFGEVSDWRFCPDDERRTVSS
jgi:hypothetical protein